MRPIWVRKKAQIAAHSSTSRAHPKKIQGRLGHSTIRITLDRYGHLFPSLDERLKDGLDKAFEAGRVGSVNREAAAGESSR